MIDLDVNFNMQQVDARLADVELRGKRLKPAFRELRKPMRIDQRGHARAAEGPDGAWPPRAAATEERRKLRNESLRQPRAARLISPKPSKKRSTPKALLGRLPRALLITVGELFIRATSRASFGYAHQRGRFVGRHHATKLPRRTFLWLSSALLRQAREKLTDYVVKGWKR